MKEYAGLANPKRLLKPGQNPGILTLIQAQDGGWLEAKLSDFWTAREMETERRAQGWTNLKIRAFIVDDDEGRRLIINVVGDPPRRWGRRN